MSYHSLIPRSHHKDYDKMNWCEICSAVSIFIHASWRYKKNVHCGSQSWHLELTNQHLEDKEVVLYTLQIHLILTWIRILGTTFGNSWSGSTDPHLEKVDPGPKWIRIRIRVAIFRLWFFSPIPWNKQLLKYINFFESFKSR